MLTLGNELDEIVALEGASDALLKVRYHLLQEMLAMATSPSGSATISGTASQVAQTILNSFNMTHLLSKVTQSSVVCKVYNRPGKRRRSGYGRRLGDAVSLQSQFGNLVKYEIRWKVKAVEALVERR